MSTARTRTIPLTESSFDARSYASGEEGIVLTTQVPSTNVWQVPVGQPITLSLVARQEFTVNEGTAGQVIDLAPDAPIVDYLDDPQAGEFSEDSYILGYFDSDDDGTPDTMITDSTTVQYNGTWTVDGDFVDSFELDETSGNASTKAVEFYVVQRYGLASIKKRNSGAGNVSKTLQGEDQITWAFSSPYAPDADRQLTWDNQSGLDGIIPPKFNLDVVFFSEENDLDVELERANNLEVNIPIGQRPVREDEDPKELRRKVTAAMTDPE